MIRPITAVSIHFNLLDDHKFLYESNKTYSHRVAIDKGVQSFRYLNFYEVMFWYRFYICKKGFRIHDFPRKFYTRVKGIDHMKAFNIHNSYYKSNYQYMSRTPAHYKTVERKKGLAIVRKAMEAYIEHYQGIPPYFFMDNLDRKLCYVSE